MIVGIAMVRDEADIITYTLEHLRRQGVDRFLILDNGSVDGTTAQLSVPGVEVIHDPERGYYQSDKMSGLAQRASDEGAGWVVPFDADELWYSPDGRTLTEVLDDVPDTVDVVAATEYKHWPTTSDTPGTNPFTRLTYRETEPHHLHKVAFRAAPGVTVHMGNHGVNFGRYNPDRPDPAEPLLELRHFPYRSFDQFVRKVRNGREAYEASRLHPMFGTHWREMGALSEGQLVARWSACQNPAGCDDKWLGHGPLVHDPAPW